MPNPEHLMVLTGELTRVTQDGAPDEYGDPTEQTTTETVACWLAPVQRRGISGGTEQTALDNTQSDEAALWLPAGTDPTGLDRIAIDDVTWELIGPPLAAMNPRTGQVSHIEAKVSVAT